MSKRDGRMYIVQRIATEVDTTLGKCKASDDDCAGVAFVYWTKKAARKAWGKDVEMIDIAAQTGREAS